MVRKTFITSVSLCCTSRVGFPETARPVGVLQDSISTVALARVLSSFSHLVLPSPGLILSHHKLKNNKSRKEGEVMESLCCILTVQIL